MASSKLMSSFIHFTFIIIENFHDFFYTLYTFPPQLWVCFKNIKTGNHLYRPMEVVIISFHIVIINFLQLELY